MSKNLQIVEYLPTIKDRLYHIRQQTIDALLTPTKYNQQLNTGTQNPDHSMKPNTF
jgi:hypothetical protein